MEVEMRIFTKLAMLLVLALVITGSCVSTPGDFSEARGKEWLLVEVKTQPQNITFNRKTLKSDGYGNIFSLTFDGERLSGVAAPNRYTAPYTLEDNHGIKVNIIAGTMMAALHEPEKLREHIYYTYLQNAYRWRISNNLLELSTKNADGVDAVLIFSR